MNTEILRKHYNAVKNSDDYEEQMEFVDLLLTFSTKEVIAYHFALLRHQDNRDLYLELRAAFAERGDLGARFLINRLTEERDLRMRAEILHILGTMSNPAALPLAREAVQSTDPDFRDRGCYVLGWIGERSDIEFLSDRVQNDLNAKVRADAATAHSQIVERLPSLKNSALHNLKIALEREKDEEVAGWIIVTIQNIIKKRFGMIEDIEEGELKGDVVTARTKCLNALERLKL